MAGQSFEVGDRVEWEGGGALARGCVVGVAAESGCLGDYVYDATPESPRYIIMTDEGRRVAHRAEALRHTQPAAAAAESSYGG